MGRNNKNETKDRCENYMKLHLDLSCHSIRSNSIHIYFRQQQKLQQTFQYESIFYTRISTQNTETHSTTTFDILPKIWN